MQLYRVRQCSGPFAIVPSNTVIPALGPSVYPWRIPPIGQRRNELELTVSYDVYKLANKGPAVP